MAAALYYCSACRTPTVEDVEGWPVAACGCGVAIIAEARSTLAGGGGIKG